MFLEFFFLFSRFVLVLYMFRHYVFSFVAIKHRSGKRRDGQGAVFQPVVSIIVPAHNEENVIGRLLDKLVDLRYPKGKLEIIVVDDHSTDRTGEIADFFASNNPGLLTVVHRKVGGMGKAPVLNEGLKHAVGEVIGFFDADYVPQNDVLEKALPYFSNPTVGAVQGRVFVLNEQRNLVARIVSLERLGGYRVSQYARDLLGLVPQFAGTVGFVRRDLLVSLGGFSTETLAEDTDLTLRVVLAGFQVRYVNDAESGEEAVKGWRCYCRQRKRWAKGHMQCAFRYVLPLLKSRKVPLKQKVDGLLLLNVYFLPILVALSWILSLAVLIFRFPIGIPFEIAFVSGVLFFLHGNLAPFFEVIAGALCDRRPKLLLFVWLLILSYFVNVVVCSVAFLDLLRCRIFRRNPNHWHKTVHDGGV